MKLLTSVSIALSFLTTLLAFISIAVPLGVLLTYKAKTVLIILLTLFLTTAFLASLLGTIIAKREQGKDAFLTKAVKEV